MAPLMAGQPPVVVVPGSEGQVDSERHRPCPMALTALCHSAAAVSSISSFDLSSSFPSPRGVLGHSDRPHRSRPDPSLPHGASPPSPTPRVNITERPPQPPASSRVPRGGLPAV